MKIYLVVTGTCADDRTDIAVFSSRKHAESAVRSIKAHSETTNLFEYRYPAIFEYEMDANLAEWANGMLPFHIYRDADGAPKSANLSFSEWGEHVWAINAEDALERARNC